MVFECCTDEDSELDEVKEILGRIDTAATGCDFSYLDDEVQAGKAMSTQHVLGFLFFITI